MSYYTPLSRRLSEYAASFLSPYIKLDDESCSTNSEELENDASRSHSKPNTQSSLSVGLWSGNVELKNVELRPDAIENFLNNSDQNNLTSRASSDANDFDSPGTRVRWKLLRGTIESVNIRIPWKSLVVGSSQSSLKKPSDKSGNTLPSVSETIDAESEHASKTRGGDVVEATSAGCTVVTIEGVNLQIGYEIIHEDRFMHAEELQNTMEKDNKSNQNSPCQDMCSDPSQGDLERSIIRDEKNRILQIAERRLLAGLDPFPPTLMAGLKSTLVSSIQQGIKSAKINSSTRSDGIENKSGMSSGYRARMEDYFSSTMRNIVWRTFDSLSVSIVHIHMSIVGYSHYDKNDEANLRRSIEKRKQQEDMEKEENILKPRQSSNQQKDPHARRQDETFSWLHTPPNQLTEELDVSGDRSHRHIEVVEHTETEQDNAWADEGEIEIGFLLDRFDIRPATLLDNSLAAESHSVTSDDSTATTDKGQNTQKHFHVTNFGVFLRRSCTQNGEDNRTFSNNLKNDDFIVDPTNITALMRFYRSSPESLAIDDTGTMSTVDKSSRKRNREQSDPLGTDNSSESFETTRPRRRGKRDKKTVTSLPEVPPKRSRRVEISVQLGHVRSSLSTRQLFLLHSFSASMNRQKRGRPSTAIRKAMAHDKKLIDEMNSEGMPIIDWDESIAKTIPALRFRRYRMSSRILPTVVSSWWKYAYICVVHELNRRDFLLQRSKGTKQMARGMSNIKPSRKWDFEKQRKIRRNYIELYLAAHGFNPDDDAEATSSSDSAVAKVSLRELEDKLFVERILLLRNIARAALIQRKRSGPKQEVEYFSFGPNSHQNEEHLQALSREKLILSEFLLPSDQQVLNDEQVYNVMEKGIDSSIIPEASNFSGLPRSSKTVFVSLKVSGYSLAFCDFVEDRMNRTESDEYKINTSDDISALTGFSDGDDILIDRLKVQQMHEERRPSDVFDPSCIFWTNSRHGLSYKPITLVHMVGLSASGQNDDGDQLVVECNFSIGGIGVTTFKTPSYPKRIISLGHVPKGKGNLTESSFSKVIEPKVVAAMQGSFSFASGVNKEQSSTLVTNISPAKFMMDWDGLETLTSFWNQSKDISKGNVLNPIGGKTLAYSSNTSLPIISLKMKMEWKQVTLVIPILDKDESSPQMCFVTIIDSISMGSRSSVMRSKREPDLSSDRSSSNESRMRATLNNLIMFMSKEEEFDSFAAETRNASASLLQCPLNIQIDVLSSDKSGIPKSHESKTKVSFLSPVYLLVSNNRLQDISRLIQTCSSAFLRIHGKSDEGHRSLQPTLSANVDSIMTETQLFVPSLAISLISDSERNDAVFSEFVWFQLEEIISTYLSQLSCLDFNHPSKISSGCMANLCLNRCCAVGLSKDDATNLLQIAESQFKDDMVVIMTCDEKNLYGKMDALISNATKKAMSKFDLAQRVHSPFWHPHCDIVVRLESLAITRSNSILDNLITAVSEEICVQNRDTQLLCISSSGESSAMSTTIATQNQVPNEESSFDIHLEISHINVVFLAEAYINSIETLQSTYHYLSFYKTQDDGKLTSFGSVCLNGKISSVSILLADKSVPFLRCRLGGLSGQSIPFSDTSVVAKSLVIECVSPYGAESYPVIVETHQSSGFDSSPAVNIQRNYAQTTTSKQAEISVALSGVKITILYQFLCELLQFVSSPRYGLGLLSNHVFGGFKEKATSEGSPPATSTMNITLRNSTLIIPRESKSIDLVGVEVEELSISPSKAKNSWSIHDYSSLKQSSQNSDAPSSSSCSESFFDCMDDIISPESPEEHYIPRVCVKMRNARIFTALPKDRKSSSVHMPQWNAHVKQEGRIRSGKRAYRACGDTDGFITCNIESRTWEEVTIEPLSLGITMDWDPTLRLLVETLDIGDFDGISFDLRMSQFYLLLAIWYNNMDELPLMFPYNEEQIKELSADLSPPLDWPEYGSEEFIKRIKFGTSRDTFEMIICVSSIMWRCSFDSSNYFGEGIDPEMFSSMPPTSDANKNAIILELRNAVCNMKKTEDTLLCVGLAAVSLNLIDARYADLTLARGIKIQSSCCQELPIDFNWGLDSGCHTLVDGLPLPVQATVFMTPDYYCMINLGLDMAEASSKDLGAIWILLDYFGLYFKEPEYGHPTFEAERMAESYRIKAVQAPCLDIDFRLWLTDPHIIIPTSSEIDTICLMLEGDGIHYRYKSFGLDFSSQDIVAKDIGIVVLSKYIDPNLSRGLRQVSGALSSSGVKTLADKMSFSILYEYNDTSNFTRFAVRVPLSSQDFLQHKMNGSDSFDDDIKPLLVPPPLICNPLILPPRNLGENETKIYFSYEYMKLAIDLLIDFIGPNPNEGKGRDENAQEGIIESSSSQNIFSVTAHLENIKVVVSDPMMGMHRPFFSVYTSSLLLTASKLKEFEHNQKKYDQFLGRGNTMSSGLSHDSDLQACMDATIFVDYFKLGMTRNWEPLIEPFRCLTMYEQSVKRGKGMIFDAGAPLHLNITGASVDTIDDAIDTFGMYLLEKDTNCPPQRQSSDESRQNDIISTTITSDEFGRRLTIHHKFPNSLNEQERIAFSFQNFSGQRVRVHTRSDLETDPSGTRTTVTYLEHNRLMPVSFPATETLIRNLQPVEVSVEGDQNITVQKKHVTVPRNHSIDVQIPGFKWTRDISLDKMGKQFIELIPRSPIVQSKSDADWRLKNALHILADVNAVNGGRRLCVMSPFELLNKTDHSIFVAIHPDPRHEPQVETSVCNDTNGIVTLDPDGSHSIPYMLLESAMHLEGNHLGSIWIRPDQDSLHEIGEMSHMTADRTSKLFSPTDHVGYPSRPVQIAKILHESSVIFKNSNGDPRLANQVASGTEITCPISDTHKKRKAIPFCYVLEVKRSPLFSSETSEREIADAPSSSSPTVGKGLRGARIKFSRGTSQSRATMHAPVAYTLVIHPPIVIENLLPEQGRFELMNATNKTVLWWGNLEPGERFPIHTVGLDAPLLLLVNLGFCRSPIGEGVLIHDGEGDEFWLKTGWRNVGSAISDTQDKVKKTISTITKSKDSRGAERVTKLQQRSQGRERKKQQLNKRPAASDAFGDEVENKRVKNRNIVTDMTRLRETFSAEDIASEITVVDSVGQRLTLHIDNVLGNGGQRHVTVFSPYWIVNTTEHSLRYKQEKSLSYVSGTVWDADKDGSKPVDGSNRNEIDETATVDAAKNRIGLNLLKLNTIFPGTHGALKELDQINNNSLKPALLAALISEELPLSIIAKLAFMFNFQEILTIGGSPRLCIQLSDSTNSSRYTSAWSSGFGLESVGVTQIVGMLCKDGRGLEVMVSISVAPGRLSNYTKIVRICPRYVILNQLPQQIRLWQDNSLLHPNHVAERGDIPYESRKWIFVDGRREGVIHQYEPLFGSPTLIDSSNETVVSTTAHHSACYITTISGSELKTFHLPDTRLERLLRVEVGSGWNLSSSFPSDNLGQFALSLDHSRDIQTLPHASTRAAPYFNVVLPPPGRKWNGDLGVWFETDWGKNRSIVVKGTREGSYASQFTDIVVGDELVLIDDVPVTQFTFNDAMKHLKACLALAQDSSDKDASQHQQQRLNMSMPKKRKLKRMSLDSPPAARKESITLTFVTLEEKMRRLRSAAASKSLRSPEHISAEIIEDKITSSHDTNKMTDESSRDILVDMNYLYQTIFVNIKEPDPSDPPHRIINRSSSWDIYYRQRACDSHPWKCLSPGESASYTWEEPMKPKKLSVRVGPGEWDESYFSKDNRSTSSTVERKRKRRFYSVHFVENEEQGHFGATKTVKLEDIGYIDRLPCPIKGEGGKMTTDGNGNESGLHCYVDTEGATRVLVVSDEAAQSLGRNESLLARHLGNMKRELREEKARQTKISMIRASIEGTIDRGTDSRNSSALEEELSLQLSEIVDYDEGSFMTRPNQVIVEVLEATGLQSANLSGLSNPYCNVSLIEGKKKMRTFSFGSKVQSRSTYFVEKSVNPQWSRQTFVFDVPSKAANDQREARRLSILCVVQSEEKFGPNKFLGQSYVHLRNLEDQRECIGWYPLLGNVGKNEESIDSNRGAIRLRVQWVFNYPGLLDYYTLCSERRIETITKGKAGMKRQLKTLREEEQQRKEVEESLSLGKVPALAAAMYKQKKTQSIENIDIRPNQENRIIKGIKRVANAKSALAQFKLTKGDQGQSNPYAGKENDFEDILDGINEVYASDFSDDSFDSLPRIQSYRDLGTPMDHLQIPNRSVTEDNIGKIDTSTTNEDASNRILRYHTHHCDRARFQYLRHSSRGNNENAANIHSIPLFTSLHVSRAFLNALSEKKSTSLKFALSNKVSSPEMSHGGCDDTEKDRIYHQIISHLRLPSSAPSTISNRGSAHIRDLMHSRMSFSKAARRSLESVLNPGGVLIIRPITALNLPETYTGMFVKLRCGNKMYQTNRVDSTVAPVWSEEETPDLTNINNTPLPSRKALRKENSYNEADYDLHEVMELFSPTRYWGTPKKNDLILNVDPFETSKSLHLTVIGEKLQAKEVIGVLEIPLGKALECCSQSMEDFQENLNEGKPRELSPAYVRWFPLMSPSLAVPVEGDMGQSTRPSDSEKLKDNMFEEYFAPCIKLALLFKPNQQQTERLKTDQYIFTRLDRISVAVVDSFRANELLSFSSRDVDLRISVTKAKTRTALTVGNVQIDQQSSNIRCKAPVIFAPSPSKHTNPTIQFLCWKDNVRSKNDMDSYDYVALFLEEMDLKIEEMWLFEVWEFYFHVMKKRNARLQSKQNIMHLKSSKGFAEDDDMDNVMKNALSFLQADKEVDRRKKIYVCELMFGYTKINLSYYKSSKGNFSTTDISEGTVVGIGDPRLEGVRQWFEARDDEIDDRTHFDHVNMFSTVFPSISDAPIKFQGKLIEHVFEFEGDISKYLLSFYASEALRQIYKIVGSLDFVGNPTMVVSSFSTGLRDFVLQPSRELKHLTKNPSRFGVGVLRGTLSLVSNSTSGVFGFFSNVGSTVGSTAALLTLDKQFQDLHSEQQAAQQRNYDRLRQRGFGRATLLVTRPVTDVVFGLVSASTGLIMEPYRGAKKDGFTGFARGTAVGVIGVFVKPVVGLSDAFAHVMESVHDLAKDINLLEGKSRPNEKYRLSYVFGIERVLLPFSQVDSVSAALLKTHPIDKKADECEEVIVASEALKVSSGLHQYIIVTTKRVVLFKVKVVEWHGFVTSDLIWQALFGDGARTTSSLGDTGHNSSILYISRFYSKESSSNDLNFAFDETDLDPTVISLRNRSWIAYPRPETPRQSGVPFRLRAWPFGTSDDVAVNHFVVDGEFEQRPNLCRIHNSICCLSRDFTSIVDEGNTRGVGEGLTVFGPLIFENESDTTEEPNLRHLYQSLELDDPLPQPKLFIHKKEDQLRKHRHDEVDEDISSLQDAPPCDSEHDSPLVATPLKLKRLFVNDDAGFRNEDTMELSLNSIEEKSRGEGSSRNVLKSIRSEHVQYPTEKEEHIASPSLEAMSLKSWTPSPSVGRDADNSDLDERLRRVENMIEHLSIAPPLSLIDNTFSIGQSGNEYAVSSNLEIASSNSSLGKQTNRESEIERLQQEILILKQQLHAKRLDTVVEGRSASSRTREAQSKSRFKARMRKMFRKKKDTS